MNPGATRPTASHATDAPLPRSRLLFPLGVLALLLLVGCSGSPPDDLGSLEEGLAPCPETPNCVHTGDGYPEGTPALLLSEAWAGRSLEELAEAVRAGVEGLPRTEVVRLDEAPVEAGPGLYLRAESTSRIFRFVDDLEVHLAPGSDELVVRSASRMGESDMGVNEDRVAALRTRLERDGVVRVGAGESAGVNVDAGLPPRTGLEMTGYERHTTHDELARYLAEVRAVGSDMELEVFGRTHEGRDLFLASFSRPLVGSPEEAVDSGKPILLLGANAHGFNYLLRESLLRMIRELATPGTELNGLLDHMIVLVVPSKNPDGVEADSRFNAVGADLNRDYMTLDQPETAAYVGSVIRRWQPHLVVDGHDGGAVQYGGARPYSLLYQGPATAAADASLTELADHELFPRIDRSFEEAGLEAFYWARGDEQAWYGGGSATRMGRNYGGLANTLSILFEFAEWHERPVAVESGVLAYKTVLEFARDRGELLIRTVDEARRLTVELGERAQGEIPVEESMEADEGRVSYRISHPERPDELLEVEDAEHIKKPVGTRFRARPWAYLLPADATEAVEMVRRHGIEVERLDAPMALPVQSYELVGIRREEGVNEVDSVVRVEIGAVEDRTIEFDAGTWMVRTGQPLGRVATHLLEAETTESVVYWNRMGALLPTAELSEYLEDPAGRSAPFLPIYKLMSEIPAP